MPVASAQEKKKNFIFYGVLINKEYLHSWNLIESIKRKVLYVSTLKKKPNPTSRKLSAPFLKENRKLK